MRIVFFLSVILLTVAACSEECMVECKFDGTTQIDTTLEITVDTSWIIGGDSVILVYENEDMDELMFNITKYERSYSSRSGREACGECGDSVNVMFVIPHLSYEAQSDQDLLLKINFDSDYIITQDDGLYQCLEGTITFVDGSSGTSNFTFVADCNSFFGPDVEKELNKSWLDLLKTDVDTTIQTCPIDSGNFYIVDGNEYIPEVAFGRGAPVKMFRWKGDCWNFKEARTK